MMNHLKERFYQKIFSQNNNPVINKRKCNLCGNKIKPIMMDGKLREKQIIVDHFSRKHGSLLEKAWESDTPNHEFPVNFPRVEGCSICSFSKKGRIEHSCKFHPYIVNMLNQVENLKKC